MKSHIKVIPLCLSKRMSRRMGFRKYGPLVLHLALTTVVAMVCLRVLDGRTFNVNSRRPQYVEADGSVSHSSSFVLLQSDITTIVSLAATFTRVVCGWWSKDQIWRSILVVMERGGISIRGLSQAISNRPPTPRHFTQKRNAIIIFITIVASFAIDYFSAALTGSFVWEPAVGFTSGRVPLTGITRGVSGVDVSGYFNYNSNRNLVVQVGSASAIVAWGTHPSDFSLNGTEPFKVFRRVIKRAQNLSINSSLNITMPYFTVDAFEWAVDPDQALTDKQLPLFHDYSEFSPYYPNIGIGGLLPDSQWGPPPVERLGDPEIKSETRLFAFQVGRFGSDAWSCPQNYTIDPGFQVNLHEYRFPGYYTDCFAIANMTYRAGAITCQSRNCRLISSTIVEAQPPFSLVGDPLTSMALALAPSLGTNFFFSNFSVPSNYGTRRNLAIEVTSRAYQAAWTALSDVLISESDDTAVEIALPTLRAKVIYRGVCLWAVLHVTVLACGFSFISVQSHCVHPWVEDVAMTIFWLDTKAVRTYFSGGQRVVSDLERQPIMEIHVDGTEIRDDGMENRSDGMLILQVEKES